MKPNHGVQLIGYSLRSQNCILFNTACGFSMFLILFRRQLTPVVRKAFGIGFRVWSWKAPSKAGGV